MQKMYRAGRRSPQDRLGSQEALEGENIETLQQPRGNQRSWPRVALSGAIREREIRRPLWGHRRVRCCCSVRETAGARLGRHFTLGGFDSR